MSVQFFVGYLSVSIHNMGNISLELGKMTQLVLITAAHACGYHKNQEHGIPGCTRDQGLYDV